MKAAAIVAFAAVVLLVPGSGSATSGAAPRPAVTIRMGEFFYKPRVAVVHVGQTVRFVNVGKIVHTVADTDAKWNIRSKLIHPRPLAHGQVQVVTFSKAGTVSYLCTFHPTLMRGKIVVKP